MAASAVESLRVRAYRVPTEEPESDGTLSWDSTTLVLVEAHADGCRGLGMSYADVASAVLVRDKLAPVVQGADPFAIAALHRAQWRALRNLGRPGVAAMALSAVDNALWDLKARLLGVPLARLLGAGRTGLPVYGSGGFTSYSEERLAAQLAGWVEEGITRVKMKVGRDPDADPERVWSAREAIGDDVELFVDANGAYDRKQAITFADVFYDAGASWFEEPVSSDDRDGLRFVRDHVPAALEVSAGEYGYTPDDFLDLLSAGAVDVLQADVTRCGGISGFLRVAALCEAFHIPLSSHTAPTQTLPVAAACPGLRHMEWFHDHVRIERMLFEGAPQPVHGVLPVATERAGLGIELLEAAEAFRVEF